MRLRGDIGNRADLEAGTDDCPRACTHDEPDCALDAWVAEGHAVTVVRFARPSEAELEAYLATGVPPGRLGNAHPSIVPYQAFAAADAHSGLASAASGTTA